MAQTLKVGSKGDSVKKLQTKLGIKADGIFGKQTEKAVKDYQAKNKLVSDGVVGSKTNSSLNSINTGGMSKPNANKSQVNLINSLKSQNLSYSTPKQTKSSSGFSSLFSNLGKTLKNIGGKALGASALGASADENTYEGYVLNPTTFEDGSTYTPPTNPLAQRVTTAGLPNVGTGIQDAVDNISTTKTSADETNISSEPNSQTMDLSLGLDAPSPTQTISNSDTENTNDITTMDSPTAITGDTTSIMNTGTYNPEAAKGAFDAIGTIGSSIGDIKNDPWTADGSKTDKTMAITNYRASDIANKFQDEQEFINFWNANPKFREEATKNGIKPDDITSKIIPLPTVKTEPLSTEQYLSQMGGLMKGGDTTTQNYNKQLMAQATFLSKMDKQRYENLNQDRQESYKIIEMMEERERRREAAIEDRAEWSKAKLKAQLKSQEADLEEKRLQSKTNLTEFLASVGALRTDGNAKTGMENLEAKYTGALAGIKSQYNLAVQEIDNNMYADLDKLQGDMDENIMKITQDLNKSQREVDADIIKERYKFNIDSLKLKMDRDEKLQEQNDKYLANAEKAAKSWYYQFFNQSGLNQFLAESPEYQQEWVKNAQSWVTPDMKGSIGAGNVRKSASDFEASKPDLELTNTQKLKLSQQGVDVNKYVSDLEYRDYVDSQME